VSPLLCSSCLFVVVCWFSVVAVAINNDGKVCEASISWTMAIKLDQLLHWIATAATRRTSRIQLYYMDDAG
jgi:hypothetical protein